MIIRFIFKYFVGKNVGLQFLNIFILEYRCSQNSNKATCRISLRPRAASLRNARYSRHDARRHQAEQGEDDIATSLRGVAVLESEYTLEGEF